MALKIKVGSRRYQVCVNAVLRKLAYLRLDYVAPMCHRSADEGAKRRCVCAGFTNYRYELTVCIRRKVITIGCRIGAGNVHQVHLRSISISFT